VTPYFQQAGITIYHGDARELLPTLHEGDADVVLTDPPYGIGKAEWDTEFPTWWMGDASRIAPIVAVMPGTWNLLKCPPSIGKATYKWTLSAHLLNGMTRGGLGFGNWIPCVVYKRTGPRASVVHWCRRFADWCDVQGITKADLDRACGTSDMGGWWLGRLEHRCAVPTVAQWAKIKASFGAPDDLDVEPNDYTPRGDCRDFLVGADDMPDHPSPKPLSVTRWLLECLPGAVVLDPFAGSGTTLRAAMDLGRRAIGIEIEERYCEIAAKRLSQQRLPLEVA
jgi:hypothetical protein